MKIFDFLRFSSMMAFSRRCHFIRHTIFDTPRLLFHGCSGFLLRHFATCSIYRHAAPIFFIIITLAATPNKGYACRRLPLAARSRPRCADAPMALLFAARYCLMMPALISPFTTLILSMPTYARLFAARRATMRRHYFSLPPLFSPADAAATPLLSPACRRQSFFQFSMPFR
jgi:hypothetical protein